MEVTASVDNVQVFAGDEVRFTVEFKLSENHEQPDLSPILLSGYALVQGSFRLGDTVLGEPFAATKRSVILRRSNASPPKPNQGLLTGLMDGFRSFVVSDGGQATTGSVPAVNSLPKFKLSAAVGPDDQDFPIFATEQLLLFPDLQLKRPERFTCFCKLPDSLPPTYRSRSISTMYQLVIGFERLDLEMQSKPEDFKLFLPFRLLAKPPNSAEPNPEVFDLTAPLNLEPPEFAKVNSDNMSGFIDDLLGGANDLQNKVTRRRSDSIAQLPGSHYTKVSYEINRNGVNIAQLVLAKPAICIGDVLSGQLKLSRPCIHISIYLELEEVVEEQFMAFPSPLMGGAGDKATHTVFSRQFLGCYGLQEVPIYLPTLTSMATRFDTEQVSAKWCLHLEFVGLAGTAFGADDESDELLAKNQIDHEMFSCRIPVFLLPPPETGPPVSKTWKLY